MLLRLFSRLSSGEKIRITRAIVRANQRELQREGRLLSAVGLQIALNGLEAALDDYDSTDKESSE